MPKTRKTATRPGTPAIRHKDKRKNIPTGELRDFVRDEDNAPREVVYLCAPDLDP